jgi:hypothetical protein
MINKLIKLNKLFFIQPILLLDYVISRCIFCYLTKFINILLIQPTILFIFDPFKTIEQIILHKIRRTNEINNSFT